MIGYIVDAFAVFGFACFMGIVMAWCYAWLVTRRERNERPLGFNGR